MAGGRVTNDLQVQYAAYVKEATDAHQDVLPFGRWKQAVDADEG